MLAIGYELLWQWVEEQPTALPTEAPTADLMRALHGRGHAPPQTTCRQRSSHVLRYLLTGLPVIVACMVLQSAFAAKSLKYYARITGRRDAVDRNGATLRCCRPSWC